MKALMKKGSVVSVCDTDRPRINAANDVLIRIALAGLCRTDMEVASGRIPCKDSLILGHEFSGIVERTGGDVDGLHQGDRVTVMPFLVEGAPVMRNGIPSYAKSRMMGVDCDGAFGEYTLVPASAVYRLPDHVSFIEGAYMEPIAASMAVLNASILPGQKGLIFGENRISRLTERILKAKRFTDISICDKNQTLPEDTYDFIIETSATTETLQKMMKAVKPGGRIVLKSRQPIPVALSITDLVMKDIAMEAVSYGDFQAGIDLVASGKLKIDDLFGDVSGLEDFESVFAKSRLGESKKLFFSAAGPDVWTR